MKYLITAIIAVIILGKPAYEAYRQDRCDKISGMVNVNISNANSCETDSDCIGFFPSCPFGCGSYINKSKREILESQIKDYDNLDCPKCIYDCAFSVKPDSQLKCINNICK